MPTMKRLLLLRMLLRKLLLKGRTSFSAFEKTYLLHVLRLDRSVGSCLGKRANGCHFVSNFQIRVVMYVSDNNIIVNEKPLLTSLVE